MINKNRTVLKSVILIMVILLSKVIVSNKSYFSQTCHNSAIKIKYSVINFTKSVSSYFSYYYRSVKNIPFYLRQNTELKNQLHYYKNLEQKLQLYKIENEKLKKILNLTSNYPYKLFTTKLLFLEESNYSCRAVILTSKGIKKNQLVIGDKNVIGKIHSILKNYSTIILPNDTQFRMSCITQNEELCIISGQGKGELLVITYKSEEGAKRSKVGDIIFSSTDHTDKIVGIPIAKIVKIKDDKAYAKLIIPIQSNSIVHVIKGIKDTLN